MTTKDPIDVARRCLCLELLLQRLGLETDDEDPAVARDEVRSVWLSRVGDLGVEEALSASERGLLERPVGELSEDEVDDLHGRASGAVVLLWALGRLETKPTAATFDDMESVIGDHGILGDGSVKGAAATVSAATLRAEEALSETCRHYERAGGVARDPQEAEKIVARIAAHHLSWILDPEMPFEEADA